MVPIDEDVTVGLNPALWAEEERVGSMARMQSFHGVASDRVN
jgi:hypothetical protein